MTYEDKALERIMGLVEKQENGCWIWQGAVGGGVAGDYPSMHYKKKTARATRVMYELTYGEIPKGLYVCHKCDTPKCVNPDHLFLGTQKHNMRDASRKGRIVIPNLRGGDHGNAKFTDNQVIELRKQYQSGRKLQSIIDEYGVNRSTIQKLLSGKTYSHLPIFSRGDSYMNHRKEK